MLRISEIVEQGIHEYENGNVVLAEAMLDFALRLAKKKKKSKYKGTSNNVPTNYPDLAVAEYASYLA